ncbi:MAG: beta-ketoacyl-[acyl-carrier-protein] synthase family protein [Pirellulaceae bacterium]
MRRRVVVTGYGVVNPFGCDVEVMWKALLASRSAVGPITLFDATHYPTKIAAEVRNYRIEEFVSNPEAWLRRGRHARFAIGAATQAVRMSGILDAGLAPERIGVYLGAGEGNQDFPNFMAMLAAGASTPEFHLDAFMRRGRELVDSQYEGEQEPNMPAAHVASTFDLQGPNCNSLTACAASSQAVGEATELIRQGQADAMLAGGAHSMIHPFGVTGFNLLTALSTSNDPPEKASRPFDKLRDGFVLGEGAGVVVLEELEHARRRGAPIVGEVLGYGTTADAYRITDIHPEGRGAIGCMRQALLDGQLNPSDIGYVNAHGTSTSVNDRVETLACKEVFGEYARQVPVSSTKSMMGHLIAAAGVTEMIVCLLALRDQTLPPTINQEVADPDCDLDYVPNVARPSKLKVALNNSFGFGGQNVTLALGRFQG